ncbi:CHASE2 domain-containing protein [Fulvivirga sp.]|uniref:CHASE2 domain-containing protein n=1 Tax=Fulvivirga sp. TaxID=1931237 RepID=UPI0032EF1EE0
MKFNFKSKILTFLFTSLIYISGCDEQPVTDKIVVINIHNYDREKIAQQIQNIIKLNPKVIALDIQFSSRKDERIDSLLRATLQSCDNLVMASVIKDYTYENNNYQDTLGCHPYFLNHASTGFVNVVVENDKFHSLKRFSIKESVNGKIEYHFAVRTAMMFDSLKAMSFIKNKPKLIDVSYQKDQSKFQTISANKALEGSLSRADIEGKVILFGTFYIFEDNPDIFVSSLNKETEEYKPDMWGVMYHANIIAQILE